MYCLYYGDCCKRMSPLTHPEPCPHIVERSGFCFCGAYSRRPTECIAHEYQTQFCPIGLDVLKLKDLDSIRKRIDGGWELIRRLPEGWIDTPKQAGEYWLSAFCDGRYVSPRIITVIDYGRDERGLEVLEDHRHDSIPVATFAAKYYPKAKWMLIEIPATPRGEK